ncbi:MAG: S-layer protein domain-containing protein [Candidatus Methanoperedens sp.]|nr:S-layer protein domain-containing protein [Candidatus Methanoperedens sp.]
MTLNLIEDLDAEYSNPDRQGLYRKINCGTDTTKASMTLKVVENGHTSTEILIAFGGSLLPYDGSGEYDVVGWMGRPYVAVKGNAKKFSRIVIEQGNASSDKKILAVRKSGDVGDGWTLTANSIDAKASPRQVWFSLSKDGVKLYTCCRNRNPLTTCRLEKAGWLWGFLLSFWDCFL